MSWAAALLTFLQAVPDIVKLLGELMTWLNHVSGNDPQGWIKKVGATMNQLNSAQTEKERQDAAKAVADAVAGLP